MAPERPSRYARRSRKLSLKALEAAGKLKPDGIQLMTKEMRQEELRRSSHLRQWRAAARLTNLYQGQVIEEFVPCGADELGEGGDGAEAGDGFSAGGIWKRVNPGHVIQRSCMFRELSGAMAEMGENEIQHNLETDAADFGCPCSTCSAIVQSSGGLAAASAPIVDCLSAEIEQQLSAARKVTPVESQGCSAGASIRDDEPADGLSAEDDGTEDRMEAKSSSTESQVGAGVDEGLVPRYICKYEGCTDRVEFGFFNVLTRW